MLLESTRYGRAARASTQTNSAWAARMLPAMDWLRGAGQNARERFPGQVPGPGELTSVETGTATNCRTMAAVYLPVESTVALIR